VTIIHRHGTVDDLLATYSSAAVVADPFPGIADALRAAGSLYRVFTEHYGMVPVRAWSRASLEIPPGGVVAALRLAARDPIWLLESVNRNAPDSRAIEYTRTWMRPDVIRLTFEMGEER
jgi:DNA-binding GntR family transcriptional regulator